ncbi:unnamed protein product [Tuber melanosporum]|uniref:(Perigord truffle) hypothetical protein n=1 Tax=Tuber melanosporum (strain Mel28) TaxID=656061 RepID=D5GNW6_TUBMM|nr:uncharacterized protein GSTUM_00011546001 [Tuber melanosporum]CAZ86209.1 unnamed protein product [Tuber melanosporum]
MKQHPKHPSMPSSVYGSRTVPLGLSGSAQRCRELLRGRKSSSVPRGVMDHYEADGSGMFSAFKDYPYFAEPSRLSTGHKSSRTVNQRNKMPARKPQSRPLYLRLTLILTLQYFLPFHSLLEIIIRFV